LERKRGKLLLEQLRKARTMSFNSSAFGSGFQNISVPAFGSNVWDPTSMFGESAWEQAQRLKDQAEQAIADAKRQADAISNQVGTQAKLFGSSVTAPIQEQITAEREAAVESFWDKAKVPMFIGVGVLVAIAGILAIKK
jgi:hypothetical protein